MVNNLRLSASNSTRIKSKATAGPSSAKSRVRNAPNPNSYMVPGHSQKSSFLMMGSMRTNKSATGSKIVTSRPMKKSHKSGNPNFSTKKNDNNPNIFTGAASLKRTYMAENINFLQSAAKPSFPVPPPQQRQQRF